jgi:hypothetical protein
VAAGGRILGREIGIKAGGWRTRIDLYARLPGGQKAFVEVKTSETEVQSPAEDKSLNQKGAFPAIISQGGLRYGPNAAKAGLSPGVPIGPTQVWIVRQPWPLGELP